MKIKFLAIVFSVIIFSGCNDTNTTTTNKKAVQTHKSFIGTVSTSSESSPYQFIPIDSANKMLTSYLNSIDYQQNDTDLRSLIFDADSLRAFLAITSIVKVKFMFAHTLDYINNGGQNKYAGYQSGALTLIVAGYDTSHNYIYFNYGSPPFVNMVLNHGIPCPANCPSGNAGGNLLN